MIEWDNCPPDAIASYYLRLPIRKGDVREDREDFANGFLRLPIGETKCSGPIEGHYLRELTSYAEKYEVLTPFREGCHIEWDALTLNLRAYAVFEDHVSRIFPNASRRDTPAGESEYLVRMTGTQARVMDHALDLYDSVQRGEIAEVEEAISYSIRDTVLSTDPDTPEAIATRRAQFNNMAVLRSLLQGMRLLIPRQDDGDPRTMAARRASEMRQAIRQQFWSEHPERYGDAWDIVIESDQPLISIERIRKDTI